MSAVLRRVEHGYRLQDSVPDMPESRGSKAESKGLAGEGSHQKVLHKGLQGHPSPSRGRMGRGCPTGMKSDD